MDMLLTYIAATIEFFIALDFPTKARMLLVAAVIFPLVMQAPRLLPGWQQA